jgi:hypothetical protein
VVRQPVSREEVASYFKYKALKVGSEKNELGQQNKIPG